MAVLYIHGKGGSGAEAQQYADRFSEEVIGLAYDESDLFSAVEQIRNRYRQLAESGKTDIIANSIGAFYTMLALENENPGRIFFISPIVDMERLIGDMMGWAKVTERELQEKQVIPTDFGEPLSWKILTFVRQNPIIWHKKTAVLYGENDQLTSRETIENFTAARNASLTVMKGGEHWFHTPEQMAFLYDWLKTQKASFFKNKEH